MRWPSTWAFFLLKQKQGPGVVDDDDVDLDNDLKRFDHLPPLARLSRSRWKAGRNVKKKRKDR
jgi:hypothetical protein